VATFKGKDKHPKSNRTVIAVHSEKSLTLEAGITVRDGQCCGMKRKKKKTNKTILQEESLNRSGRRGAEGQGKREPRWESSQKNNAKRPGVRREEKRSRTIRRGRKGSADLEFPTDIFCERIVHRGEKGEKQFNRRASIATVQQVQGEK